MNSSPSVLIASSNAGFRNALAHNLGSLPVACVAAEGGADALAKLAEGNFQTLLLDRRLGDLDSQEVLANVETQYPGIDVILMDRQEHPFVFSLRFSRNPKTRLIYKMLQAGKMFRFTREGPDHLSVRPPASPPADRGPVRDQDQALPLPGLIGVSPQILSVARQVRLVAHRQTNVLLTGETGTGKEIVARALHQMSDRWAQPFVVVNCAAIPEPLLESELFGFRKGAFTGAVHSRVGTLQAAHGGTVFFDEIGELPPNVQVKLLRFLQDGEVQILGSREVFRVDARVVAATNADLDALMRRHAFRPDLYYRLAVFPIDMPPLRDRTGDLLPLVAHFLEVYCGASQQVKHLTEESWEIVQAYEWPGNVRELQHLLERAVILAEDELLIQPKHLSFGITSFSPG